MSKKVKSKSFFASAKAKAEETKIDATFDFINYYKTAAESDDILKSDSKDAFNDTKEAQKYPKRRHSAHLNPKKRRKDEPVHFNKVDLNGLSLIPPTDGSRPTLSTSTNIKTTQVEEIQMLENTKNVSVNKPKGNGKKRNKSVSFMLEENDQIIIKKTKSNDSLISDSKEKSKHKKTKVNTQHKEDKENDINSAETSNHASDKSDKKVKKNKKQKGPVIVSRIPSIEPLETRDAGERDMGQAGSAISPTDSLPYDTQLHETDKKKNKRKHIKVFTNSSLDLKKKDIQSTVNKPTKSKKAKTCHDNIEIARKEEPKKRRPRNKSKPDVIAQGLENLNIGDNAHTLTGLLDGMTVTKTAESSKIGSDTIANEKQKRNTKRNNRRRKNRNIGAAILVQNLPFKILLAYKQVLKDFFSKYGTVHSIGIADLKCDNNVPQPIFTTRVFFRTEGEATAALDGDKELFEGNIIRVKKFQQPTSRTHKSATEECCNSNPKVSNDNSRESEAKDKEDSDSDE